MNWKQLFSKTILARGKSYYENHRVHDFVMTDNACGAEVWGSSVYNVSILFPGSSKVNMFCTCPHAHDGFYCKHMAAVMFKWEEKAKGKFSKGGAGKAAKKWSSISDLIPRAEQGREPFYHIAEILSDLRIDNEVADEAKALADSGRISISDTFRLFERIYGDPRDDGAPMYFGGRCEGEDKSDTGEMDVILTNSDMTRYRCSICGRYYERNYTYYPMSSEPLCPHILALLIETDKYVKAFDPGDYTDYRAHRFLDAFGAESARSRSADKNGEAGSVVLEPRITETDKGKYELEFRIGNGGKLYIVKNLTELHDTVNSGGKYGLGKSGSIDFATQSFAPESEELYALIERDVKRARAIERQLEAKRSYYNSGSVETKKGIPFTGDAVDTIYQYKKGGTIPFKGYDAYSPGELVVSKICPEVNVTIETETATKNKKKILDYVRVSGSVSDIIEGVRGKYFIGNGFLSEIDEDSWSKIRPFADACYRSYEGNEFLLRIGQKNAADFYYNILPKLRDDPVFRITEKSSAIEFIPAEAEFAFYLDIDEEDIICEVRAVYDDKTAIVRGMEDDFPLDAFRDIDQERPVYDELDSIFEKYDRSREAFVLADSDDARYDLLRNGVDRLMRFGEVHSTDDFLSIKIRKTPSVQIGVSVESDLLNLDILTRDMSYDELALLLQSYRQKKKYHRLRSGEFIDLDKNESLDTLMNIMDKSGADLRDFVRGKLQIPAYRALYLDRMLEGHEEIVASRDRRYRNLIRDFKTINDAEFDIPAGLNGELRSYQDYGYRWLRTLESAGFGGILADDMGLGKTIQAITMLLAYKEAGEKLRALIVCPSSVLYNWIEEIGRFAPGLSASAIAGTKSVRRELLADYESFDVLVTSYDLLKRDIDLYEELQFSHQILDEAQFVKNAKAAAAKTVKLVHAVHRYALTGTPIENRLSELWSIFDYLMPGFLYNYEQFRKSFELPISKHGDEAATEALKNMISPFILRRKKKDVLKDLPDKIEEVRYARFDTEQRKLYDAQAIRISNLIEEKGDLNTGKIEILAELTRIRQICCDPSLIFADYKGESAKREACVDLVESAADAGHKMLLFSQFASMLELLEKEFGRRGIEYYKLTGSTSKEERMRLVKAFNSDDTPVFLISLKAGGTGLNLTGADMVIHYDPWWNTAAQDQATDRAHRIGQTRDVTVFKLIAKDTIEEKIVRLQESKKELADAVLSGETRSLGSMSKEELMELIS